MRKLIRYEEPSKKDRGHYDLWQVWFDYGNGKEILTNMYKEEFKVLMKEEELIKKGYLLRDLKEYKEIVKEQEQRECYENE